MDRPRLDIPHSLTERWEALSVVGRSHFRGMMACLQLCWLAGPDADTAPPMKLADVDFNMMALGSQVAEHLLREGWSYPDLSKLGIEAYHLVNKDLMSADDLKAAEGNSEAGAEHSTSSSSTSKSGGDSAPANCDDSPGTSKPS